MAEADKTKIVGWREFPNGDTFIKDTFDASTIHPNDTGQGCIGDCYLIASLCALALQRPDFLKNMLKKNDDGSYTVTLYRWIWRWRPFTRYEVLPVKIIVTPEFPIGERINSVTGKKYTCYPHAETGDLYGGKLEIWGPIIEKAYAILISNNNKEKGYSALDGGRPETALEFLTGRFSIRFSKPQSIGLRKLAERLKEKKPMCICTIGNTKKHKALFANGVLVANHTYYVSRVDENNAVVYIRNPWNWGPEIKVSFDELNQYFIKLVYSPI